MAYRDTGLVGSDAPVGSAIAITKSDTVNLPFTTRAIWVSGAGDITAVMAENGNTVLFSGIPAGMWMPIRVTRVNSTGTTATGMVACA